MYVKKSYFFKISSWKLRLKDQEKSKHVFLVNPTRGQNFVSRHLVYSEYRIMFSDTTLNKTASERNITARLEFTNNIW